MFDSHQTSTRSTIHAVFLFMGRTYTSLSHNKILSAGSSCDLQKLRLKYSICSIFKSERDEISYFNEINTFLKIHADTPPMFDSGQLKTRETIATVVCAVYTLDTSKKHHKLLSAGSAQNISNSQYKPPICKIFEGRRESEREMQSYISW